VGFISKENIMDETPRCEKKQYAEPVLEKKQRLAEISRGDLPSVTSGIDR
jgi:hypothetical protein